MSAIVLDLCLHTADRPSMVAALTSAGLWDTVNNQPITASNQHALDFAGTLYAPDGTTSKDAQGNTIQNQQALDGVFAFLRVLDDSSNLPTLLNAIIIDQPATTLRTWSGGSYASNLRWDTATQEIYEAT